MKIIKEVELWTGKASSAPDYTTTTIVEDVHGELVGTCNIWQKGDSLQGDFSLSESFNPGSRRLHPILVIYSVKGFKNGLIKSIELVEVHDAAVDLNYFNI